jgi:hypothetical protein
VPADAVDRRRGSRDRPADRRISIREPTADLLDIRDEVEALATVIAARQIEPPLAIGLFGDWGTGKTFFMNRLEERIG